MTITNPRLRVVDSLRGFAIVSIMLLHNLEHFDFYYTPVNLPGWMISLDTVIWDSLFFLFSGKSYAIFALLFGLTFFIQSDNQAKKGKDFRGRFAWRLVLLLMFGIINSAFYQGDILTIYAIIGFFLIPVLKMSNKAVFLIAVILMLQPFEWYNLLVAIQNPELKISDPLSWSYFGKMSSYITGDSLTATLIGNLTNGKTAVLLWNWENGRVFQTLSLFMFGMLAGRKSLFSPSKTNRQFWRKALIIATALFIPLFVVKGGIQSWIHNEVITRPLLTMVTSWSNMAFMMVLVSGFVLLFQTRIFFRILSVFSPIGQMSLSNYVIQSIIGSFIYYGFGLALYQYTGSAHCLLIGITLAVLQGYFSTWWMKHHKHGPLEAIWHKATWIGSK
ncbi:MAG: DUF418 domain-containing protein [Bacteroidales bacterium]|nr:DUF418 domain-containing protein [Bacteroidales bacterium]